MRVLWLLRIFADSSSELLDQGLVFSNSAKLLLHPYKAFCRILRAYLTYDDVVAPRIINSVKLFTSRLVNRYSILPEAPLKLLQVRQSWTVAATRVRDRVRLGHGIIHFHSRCIPWRRRFVLTIFISARI